MHNDNDVAALAIFCIFGLPIAAWILFRILGFIERMAMINKGIVPPPPGMKRAWRDYQRQQQAGPASAPQWRQQSQGQLMPPPQPVVYAVDDDAQSALFKGIRLALIGFAVLLRVAVLGKGTW